MMKRHTLIPLVFVIALCSCKNPYETRLCTPMNPEFTQDDSGEYTLIVSSGAGCPYSGLALKDLEGYENKQLKIIVHEQGTDEAIQALHAQYFEDFTFVDADECKAYKNKLFPKYFLYKGDKLVWKQKGYLESAVKVLDELCR